jgi:DNA-binding LytR/AlgR family response regulator
VDVLLLDISMPGLSGLETKALLGDDPPYVVFTTAHPEHALEAFDLGAVDYVMKPVEPERLRKALERARQRLAPPSTSGGAALQRLAVPTRDAVRLLDPDSLTHAEFDGVLVTLHLRSGEAVLSDLTLSDLERRLPADRFERVHRRAIVNLACLDQLEPLPTGGYVGRTSTGEPVPISRKAARRLRRRLGLG